MFLGTFLLWNPVRRGISTLMLAVVLGGFRVDTCVWQQVSSVQLRLASQCSQEQGGASWSLEEQFPAQGCDDSASSQGTSVGAGTLVQPRRRAQLALLQVLLLGCCRAPATA